MQHPYREHTYAVKLQTNNTSRSKCKTMAFESSYKICIQPLSVNLIIFRKYSLCNVYAPDNRVNASDKHKTIYPLFCCTHRHRRRRYRRALILIIIAIQTYSSAVLHTLGLLFDQFSTCTHTHIKYHVNEDEKENIHTLFT